VGELVGAEEDRDVVCLEPRVGRVAREAPRVDEHGLPGAPVVRQQALHLGGDEPPEVRESPGDGHAKPGRRGRVVAVEPVEDRRELALRGPGLAARRRDARGHDLVVERRHQHLDAVRVDDADAVEEVLLGQRLGRLRALRRAADKLVDELVDAARGGDAGDRADDRLATRELHLRTPSGG
jgi:hypothetical protein